MCGRLKAAFTETVIPDEDEPSLVDEGEWKTNFIATKFINLWRSSEPNGHKIASPGKQ